MQYRSTSAEELQAIAARFVASLKPVRAATIVALSGELGAGKTTFTQAVARHVGVAETVASPTFVIEKIYPLSGQAFERLIHIDAYRLNNEDELRKLGWEEVAQNPGNLILMEWPERVPELLPASAIRVRIDIDGDGRIITINDGEESKENG